MLQLDGTIVAPTSPNAWKANLMWWMDFTKLVGITIQGKGVIDGSGSVWWTNAPYDPEEDHEMKLVVPLNNSILERPPMPVIIFILPYTAKKCLQSTKTDYMPTVS